MEDIYINSDNISKYSLELNEHAENVINDIKKIKELLDNIKKYWEASEASKFITSTSDFVELINSFSISYEDLSRQLVNSDNSYKKLEEIFLNKKI